MLRALAVPIAALAILAPVAQAQTGDPLDGPPACSAVVAPDRDAPRRSEAWIECNFRVADLRLRFNRRVASVSRTAVLYAPDAGDSLSCRRSGRTGARCRGSVGKDVRMRIPLRLRGSICRPPLLSLRIVASGGLDCDGRPCPEIGIQYSTQVAPVTGC